MKPIVKQTTEDTRRHEETPLFLKSLFECQSMYVELVQGSEPQSLNDLSDANGGRLLPLGETPAKWILSIAQRYVVGSFFHTQHWSVRYFIAGNFRFVCNKTKSLLKLLTVSLPIDLIGAHLTF